MDVKWISTDEIKTNPNNPRVIKDDKFKKLVKSIREFPKMLEIRPIVCNDEMTVLGGNMRLKACIDAGLTQIPILLASELTPEQQREFIIKDNLGYGDWDWEQLADDWNMDELEDWGMDLPRFIKNENVEDLSDQVEQSFRIEILCKTEEQQEKIYNELIEKGYECRLLTL